MWRIDGIANKCILHRHLIDVSSRGITKFVIERIPVPISLFFMGAGFNIFLSQDIVVTVKSIFNQLGSVISIPATDHTGIKHCDDLVVINRGV
jgi:hypothetical protein